MFLLIFPDKKSAQLSKPIIFYLFQKMLWTQPNIASNIKQNPQTNMKKIQNYVFNLNELLGAGNFSKVYKAINQQNNQVSAIKVVELSSMKNPTLIQLLYSQIQILKALKHPNILNCIQVFSSNNNCYIITQFCNEGDLESRIRDWGALSEMQARKVIYETYSALKYLSDNQIIHRDLKVANIFLNNGVSKIADFGFAKKLKTPDERFKDINIGSPIYMSPEGLINNVYGPKTDVWAFGVFIFEILHGDTPLAFCQSQKELYTNLKIPLTKDKILPNISNQLKDLIIKCLEVDEKKRISFQEMYNHPYIVYLRKLYQKPESTLLSLQQTPQTNKFKASESTNQSQQSKSQAQSQALINQYNNMTPQQRVASSLSIGNLNMTGFSTYQTPQQSISTKSQNLTVQPNTAVSNQISPSTTQQIQSSPNLQSTDVIIPNIINSVITFPHCVQLLHYCRLVYKCYNLGKSSKSCIKLNPYLCNWVLGLMSEIQKKQTTHVYFIGDRAVLRQQKLHEVISQYHTKYKNQLKWIPGVGINLQIIQQLTIESLNGIDTEIKTCRNPSDLQVLVKLAHYLYTLQEANIILKKCMDGNDFTPIASAKIEDFLNKKPQNFNLQSYGGFRNKIVLTL